MNRRSVKIMRRKAGGTAGKNAEKYSVNLPAVWLRAMGIQKDNRVELSFDGEKITVRPLASTDSELFRRNAEQKGHQLKEYRYYDGDTLCTVILADFTAEQICINLFAHSLSNALVDIALRGHQMTVTNAHLLANDLSTGGLYPKAWVRKEDGFYLYKDGGREAVEREVLASKICRCFDCHQVLYEQGMFENEPVSISKIMTSQRYSLVTYAAYDVYCTNHDWNTLDKILELDAPSYYMMNILDYLVGNTDRHWENWGLLVDNETNQPIRLHDLMDFNRAFQQYDTPEGANCLTVGKRHLSQKDAAVEAVRNIGLNQVRQVEHTVFSKHPAWKATFEERLRVLRNAM